MIRSYDFNKAILVRLGLLFLIVLAFFPLFKAGYINFDDYEHLYDNQLVWRSSLTDIFFSPDSTSRVYIPLTLLSWLAEKTLFGYNPGVSHAINIFFHLINVYLVSVLARRLGLGLSGSVAAACLFGLHPIHVEPVAWVTSRKDVLFTAFYLAGLILYIDWFKSRRGIFYILALIAGCLSILAKPMALSFPFVLFVLDRMLGRKIDRSLVLEKIPFALAILPVAAVTFFMNIRGQGIVFPDTFLVFLWTGTFYLKQFFAPFFLSPVYFVPLPIGFGNPQYLFAIAIMAVLLIYWRSDLLGRWGRFAFLFYAACTWFLWRGDMHDFSSVADRFMYLPSVGLCCWAGYIIEVRLTNASREGRRLLFLILAVLVVLLASATFRQSKVWTSSWHCWKRVIAASPNFQSAYTSLAFGILDERERSYFSDDLRKYVIKKFGGRPEDHRHVELVDSKLDAFIHLMALKNARIASGMIENDWKPYLIRGRVFNGMGEYSKAIPELIRSRMLDPTKMDAVYEMAFAYYGLGEKDKALSFCDLDLRHTRRVGTFALKADIYYHKGQYKNSMAYVMPLVEELPKYAPGHDLLFRDLAALNKIDLASNFLALERKRGIGLEQLDRHQCVLNNYLKGKEKWEEICYSINFRRRFLRSLDTGF